MPDETAEERNRRLGYRPLTLSEKQRRVLESRGIQRVQPPGPGDRLIPLQVRGREGVPFDVMLTLEAIRQLAEQGNALARFIYDQERRALGIDVPRHLT